MLEPPKELFELQNWIADLLRRPLRQEDHHRIPIYDQATIAEVRARIKPSAHLSAQQRIGLYNQQVWYRFFNLLQDDFPMLLRLFGASDFNRSIAEPYFLAHWPNHSSLLRLGALLPIWLEQTYAESDRRLVLAAVQIDAAWQRLFFAPPVQPLKNFSGKLYLTPRAVLFEMEADLFAFRKELLQFEPEVWLEREFPKIVWGDKKFYILWLEMGKMNTQEIALPAYRILKLFEKGARLEDALAPLACVEGAETCLSDWFKQCSERAWLTNAKQATI